MRLLCDPIIPCLLSLTTARSSKRLGGRVNVWDDQIAVLVLIRTSVAFLSASDKAAIRHLFPGLAPWAFLFEPFRVQFGIPF
jgi:hypothetical protein